MSHPVTPLRDLSDAEFPAPAARQGGPELVPPVATGVRPMPSAPAPARPRLVTGAGTVGGAVGRAVETVRHLPQNVQQWRSKVRSMGAGSAPSGGWSDRAQQARNRAEYYAQTYPLQTLGGIFAATFILGFAVRLWRSRA